MEVTHQQPHGYAANSGGSDERPPRGQSRAFSFVNLQVKTTARERVLWLKVSAFRE